MVGVDRHNVFPAGDRPIGTELAVVSEVDWILGARRSKTGQIVSFWKRSVRPGLSLASGSA